MIFPLCFLFFITGCSQGSHSSLEKNPLRSSTSEEGRLTKSYIRKLMLNPPANQERLEVKTYQGCVHVPAKNFVQRTMVGFRRTGETCTITLGENNTAKISFWGDQVISLISMSTERTPSDLFVAELDNEQVLLVQHHQGEVVSLTHTVYNGRGGVVYGGSRGGQIIKECVFSNDNLRKGSRKKKLR